jgi:membrane-bound lytic murein transglycosylase D
LGALFALSMLCSGISTAADSPFVHSAEIEPDIQFWERVYTEVTTDGGLVHDDRKLGVVYEVIRFPANLPRAARRAVEQAKTSCAPSSDLASGPGDVAR